MPAGAEFAAGFAKTDITPPLGVPYLSFHPRQTPFEGIHDRLYARTVAAEGPDGAAAIVSVDSLGLSRTVLGPGRDFIAELRQRIQAQTGIRPDHVMCLATHAHSTPQTTDIADLIGESPHVADWLEQLLEQLATTVALAWAQREPMALYGGRGLAPGIAWNRRILTTSGTLAIHSTRPPDEHVVKEPRDDRVPALLFRGETRRGAIFGFTCHPTTVQVQPLVSADYPGVACGLVEQALDLGAAVFVQGACGDVGPVRRTTDFQDVELYGRSLGGEATRCLALLDARDAAPMSGTIAAACRTVQAPRRELPDEQALAETAADGLARIEAATDAAARARAVGVYRRASEPLRLCRLGTGPVPVEVQALRLGEALFIGVEGELFCRYGLELIDASPAELTFVAGYANGYQGYLPEPATWDEGGYEPSLGPWTRVDRDGGELVAAAAADLAQRVWSGRIG